VIEELAQHSGMSEEGIAQAVIEFARGGPENSAEDRPSGRKTHVGYYLRDAGRALLELQIHYRPELRTRYNVRCLHIQPLFTWEYCQPGADICHRPAGVCQSFGRFALPAAFSRGARV